jgi:hypothetical protein
VNSCVPFSETVTVVPLTAISTWYHTSAFTCTGAWAS